MDLFLELLSLEDELFFLVKVVFIRDVELLDLILQQRDLVGPLLVFFFKLFGSLLLALSGVKSM